MAAVLIPFLVLLNGPVFASVSDTQETGNPLTEIVHTPLENVVAGKRTQLYTEIADAEGIDVVRMYFKAQNVVDYNFIVLTPVENPQKSYLEKFKNFGSKFEGSAYSGVLPAPSKEAESLEYLILVKNKANVVVKSQTYTVSVTANEEDSTDETEPIHVYTELSEVPSEISGFTDNIAIDVVESGRKFGVVAELYTSLKTGVETATTGGTVTASSGGFTTAAIAVASTIGVVGLVGVAAIAGGGSSSSSSSSSSGGEQLTSRTIVGTWATTEDGVSGTTTFSSNGRYIVDTGFTGSWSLYGSDLTLSHDNGPSWRATVSGDSRSFRASGPTTVYFTRR